MPRRAFATWLLLASSFQVQSAELCQINEAARLSRLYLKEGISGLIVASESCHRRKLDCQFIDAFGYTLNKYFCSRSPCLPIRHFESALAHHLKPLHGAGKAKDASLLCEEVEDLIKSSVNITLSSL